MEVQGRFDRQGRWVPPRRTLTNVRFDEQGEVVEYWLTTRAADDRALRGWQALMLAPTLEICRALMRGEHVPKSALRPEWVGRFYLRSAA